MDFNSDELSATEKAFTALFLVNPDAANDMLVHNLHGFLNGNSRVTLNDIAEQAHILSVLESDDYDLQDYVDALCTYVFKPEDYAIIENQDFYFDALEIEDNNGAIINLPAPSEFSSLSIFRQTSLDEVENTRSLALEI